MGILRYNYRSEVLGMHTDITITYPSGQYTCYTPEKEGNSIFKRGNLRYNPDSEVADSLYLHEEEMMTACCTDTHGWNIMRSRTRL